MIDDTILFDAIGKIRESSDKRREIEARVLAENNLASVRQLSEDKKKQFCAIVDAILAEQADVDTQLFADNQHLAEAASKIKVTPWTKQDNNPEKNSTFMGAPKTNPNKGGYAGGAKAEKTKNGYTAMKRIKEEEEGLGEGLIKKVVRAVAGREIANDRTRKTGISAYSSQNKAFAPGTSEADRGKHLAASKPRMKAYKKYDAISRGQKAPGGFGTRKEDVVDESLSGKVSLLKKSFQNRPMKAYQRAISKSNDAEFAKDKLASVKNVPRSEGGDKKRANAQSEINKHYKNYDRFMAVHRGNGMKFGTRKEDLEEMYLDIENFVLESEGLDSIDRLNEQGQEKLAAIVENVMEGILEEGWFSGSDKPKKTPTPNPKGAPRGERDPGDYKNPTGWANKDVDQATRIARKQMKLKGARKIPHEAW